MDSKIQQAEIWVLVITKFFISYSHFKERIISINKILQHAYIHENYLHFSFPSKHK